MNRPGRRIAGAAVAALVVAVTVAVLAAVAGVLPAESGSQQQHVLVVTDDEGETVRSIPVELNGTVVLEYTHSVEKTTVRDVYVVREDGLAMTRMEFRSYGAGLPAQADIEITEDGTFVYDLPADDPGLLRVATGEIAGHELLVGGDRYDLVDLADGGTVTLTIEADG